MINTTIKKSFFILPSVLSSIHNRKTTKRAGVLLRLAEWAETERNIALLGRIVNHLSALPLPPPQSEAARLYSARYGAMIGLDSSSVIFALTESAFAPVRARALLFAGTAAIKSNDLEMAARLYHSAQRIAHPDDILANYYCVKSIGIISSFLGDHRRALKLLESSYPIARAAARINPMLHIDWLNSIALEFAECDRFDEAMNAVRFISGTVAFAPAWRAASIKDTIDEVTTKSERRSFMARAIREPKPLPAKVFDARPIFQRRAVDQMWKRAMRLMVNRESCTLTRLTGAVLMLDTDTTNDRSAHATVDALRSLNGERQPADIASEDQ